jgi:hypothetical protein
MKDAKNNIPARKKTPKPSIDGHNFKRLRAHHGVIQAILNLRSVATSSDSVRESMTGITA